MVLAQHAWVICGVELAELEMRRQHSRDPSRLTTPAVRAGFAAESDDCAQRELIPAPEQKCRVPLYSLRVIDPTKVRAIILASANDDYTGFYELIWELNTIYPRASEAEKIDAARYGLARLFEEGLLELFAARWPRSFDRIDGPDGAAIIANRDSWLDPDQTPEGTYFAFAASTSLT